MQTWQGNRCRFENYAAN